MHQAWETVEAFSHASRASITLDILFAPYKMMHSGYEMVSTVPGANDRIDYHLVAADIMR